MFERRSPIYTLTPTRLIIGGGDEDPEIVEGATELYFRLPRLVEFYRGFLYWNGEGETYKIAMLPEVEGIFSGIIRLVFQKKTDLSSGDYSESELRTLVREINLIHAHFHSKDGERAVQAAMSALVMEVNSSPGLQGIESARASGASSTTRATPSSRARTRPTWTAARRATATRSWEPPRRRRPGARRASSRAARCSTRPTSTTPWSRAA